MYQEIRKRSALTLIELLIAILLFSAIIGAAILMLTTALKVWNSNKDRLDIVQNGSLAMQKMTRYLDLAGNITPASATSITFDADVNNAAPDETVTIAWDSGNQRINITINGTVTILTPNAQSFNLSYYALNSPAAFIPPHPNTPDELDSVRVVTISLTMNKGSDTIILSSSAYCRNQ